MDEVDAAQPVPSSGGPGFAGPSHAGVELQAAREARGLSLAEVAARTRVPLRHLEAIESGSYNQLPSPTYAVGFARSYARAVGADEVAIAAMVRADIDRTGARIPEYVPYEAADPARMPSRGVAIAGVAVALAVLILVGLYYSTGLFRGGSASGPAADVAAPPVAVKPVAAPTPAVPTGGQVSFVANDEVWLRVYDADDKTLYLGTMKPGERYDVPADAKDPMINVGRPDKLTVTLNGSVVPALGTGERPIKDVKVSSSAMAARLSGQAPAAATPTAAASATPGPSVERPRPRRRPARRARLTETQRANIESAENPPPAAPQ